MTLHCYSPLHERYHDGIRIELRALIPQLKIPLPVREVQAVARSAGQLADMCTVHLHSAHAAQQQGTAQSRPRVKQLAPEE